MVMKTIERVVESLTDYALYAAGTDCTAEQQDFAADILQALGALVAKADVRSQYTPEQFRDMASAHRAAADKLRVMG